MVEASRELGVGLLLALVMLFAWLPVPVVVVEQQTPLRFSWNPPWSATGVPFHIEAASSGAKRVAPPLAPNIRNSLIRFAFSVDRSVPLPRKRVESWTPCTGKPGKFGSRLFKVSGEESSLF